MAFPTMSLAAALCRRNNRHSAWASAGGPHSLRCSDPLKTARGLCSEQRPGHINGSWGAGGEGGGGGYTPE